MKGLTRLEVDGSVLHLHQDVFQEGAVKWNEFVISLPGPVDGNVVVIYEGSPHYYSSVWCNGSGQHVGPVGMGASVILRSGLPLGVCLDKKSPEIGNEGVNLSSLLLPPVDDFRVKRVRCGQAANLTWSAESGGQIYFYSVWPHHIS